MEGRRALSDPYDNIRHDDVAFCKELAWASSFRQRMLLLDRMDRQSNPSQFGDGCKCLIQEINGRGEWI
jgi:hypothetical protein